ncbi:MAG: glycosyltransferase family 9 protein [candidate division Zixibacteria bacterium]|nr:glycosyltransferase family 9 protein [candidate division Zixibacteria bacterium]
MPKSILVRLVDNVGDLIIGIPVFRSVKTHYEKYRLIAMVRPEQRALLNGYVNGFIAPQSVNALQSYVGIYEYVINIAYGYPDGYRPDRLKRNRVNHIGIEDWNNGRHVCSNLITGVAQHNIPVSYYPPKLRLPSAAYTRARDWFECNLPHADDSLVVAVNAGSGFKYKRWPVDRFIQVCKWLIAEFNARIIVVSRDRRDYPARKLYNALPAYARNWLTNQTLDTVAALLQRVDLCIGNDSGIGHLAAAVNTPTVTVFGPTSPRLWKPTGSRSTVVFHRENDCCCGYEKARVCRDKTCFSKITERNFADAILHSLNEHVGRDTKECLDRITVADTIVMSRNRGGTLLVNTKSPHPMNINSGLPEIQRFLNLVSRVQSYSRIVRYDPRQRPLLHFLLLHRILVSASTRRNNRWL